MPPKKKSKRKRRGKVIGFRATEGEHETFQTLAEAADLTLSQWMRLQLRRAANMPTG